MSRQEYDTAVANRMESEAALQTAQINVRYTKVYAPISGRIGRSSVTEGALVSNGQTDAMAVIQQLDPIYVDVTQSSVELLQLRRELESGRLQKAGENAAAVKLTLEDGSQYKLEGKLEFSEVSVDQTTGSVTLRAVFPNPDHTLLPGMFVHAQLQAGVNSRGDSGAATRRDPRPQRHADRTGRRPGQQGRTASAQGQPHRRQPVADRRRPEGRRSPDHRRTAVRQARRRSQGQ